MLRKVAKYFIDVPAVFIDGSLYTVWTTLTTVQTFFSGDEAERFVGEEALFWLKGTLGVLVAFFGAIKMFRSTAYADHLKDKQVKASGNTEILVKP